MTFYHNDKDLYFEKLAEHLEKSKITDLVQVKRDYNINMTLMAYPNLFRHLVYKDDKTNCKSGFDIRGLTAYSEKELLEFAKKFKLVAGQPFYNIQPPIEIFGFKPFPRATIDYAPVDMKPYDPYFSRVCTAALELSSFDDFEQYDYDLDPRSRCKVKTPGCTAFEVSGSIAFFGYIFRMTDDPQYLAVQCPVRHFFNFAANYGIIMKNSIYTRFVKAIYKSAHGREDFLAEYARRFDAFPGNFGWHESLAKGGVIAGIPISKYITDLHEFNKGGSLMEMYCLMLSSTHRFVEKKYHMNFMYFDPGCLKFLLNCLYSMKGTVDLDGAFRIFSSLNCAYSVYCYEKRLQYTRSIKHATEKNSKNATFLMKCNSFPFSNI
jgi:hypothetical protein